MKGPVVGIDLGTTNTVVSAVRDGQVSALADRDGQVLIPSVVSFHPSGTVLVGREAKSRRKIDASNTIYSVKRLIGRSWDTAEVREARSRFPFAMREGPGQAALVVARNETYTLPEISAFVLRKAKTVAEEALGAAVERAVITVPANFNDLQRAATKVAGRVAGLEVMRILNEPTAAALAYGYGKGSSERIAVYDFGGGTLDITLLDLSDNVFEVLATAGNTFLGGDDIDHIISERMADELLATHRVDARADPRLLELLRSAAEDIKKQLSTAADATVTVEEVAHQKGGRVLDFSYSLTRSELDQLISAIVSKTFDVCREALSIARLPAEGFEKVLLVGGSTRIPLVRQQVQRFFRQMPVINLNPDELVSIGAAIQANALSGAEKRRTTLPLPPKPAARSRLANIPIAPRRAAHESIQAELALGPAAASLNTAAADSSALVSSSELNRAEVAGRGDLPLVMPPEHTDFLDASEIEELPAQLLDTDDEEETLARPAGGRESRAPAPASPPLNLPTPTIPAQARTFELDPPVDRSAEQLDLQPRSNLQLAIPKLEHFPPTPPLLIDVTPLSLAVETLGGYCDTVIERNSPIPCEKSRQFATVVDNQESVKVRISQGEAEFFEQNTLLGEVILSGLRGAARGAVKIEVSFALDASGMLSVSATDVDTNRSVSTRIRLIGLTDVTQLEGMRARHAAQHMN